MQVMSSARGTPDSRHSKPLLQSRSLRDFRTPPPEKSRRRVLQVNGPVVVPDVLPPMPTIRQSEHADLVQTSKNRNKSPTSSMQVSPFIAAPRASIDTGISSSSSSSGVPTRSSIRLSGLRNPPVNPRRHRRLASDFGLDRDQTRTSPSPPIADDSSVASTPLATYAETESDSDTSVNHALEYSFPEPPPMDEILHLRRMHSSPMFNLGDTDQVKEFLKKRLEATAHVKNTPPPYDHWDGVSNISLESRHISDLEDVDVTGSFTNRVPINTSSRPRLALVPSSRPSGDISWKRATTTPTQRPSTSDGTPSLLTRSATSIRSRPEPPNGMPLSISAAPRRTSRTSPELSEPMVRLNQSLQKLQRHDPHHIQFDHSAPSGQRMPQSPSLLDPPSLASAGRQKPAPRPNLSIPVQPPVAGLGLYSTNATPPTSDPPKDPGTAFNQRATASQPMSVRPTLLLPNKPMPKSFMDITPEQEVQRGSRGRVRKLLKRASVSMFNWGKTKSITK